MEQGALGGSFDEVVGCHHHRLHFVWLGFIRYRAIKMPYCQILLCLAFWALPLEQRDRSTVDYSELGELYIPHVSRFSPTWYIFGRQSIVDDTFNARIDKSSSVLCVEHPSVVDQRLHGVSQWCTGHTWAKDVYWIFQRLLASARFKWAPIRLFMRCMQKLVCNPQILTGLAEKVSCSTWTPVIINTKMITSFTTFFPFPVASRRSAMLAARSR